MNRPVRIALLLALFLLVGAIARAQLPPDRQHRIDSLRHLLPGMGPGTQLALLHQHIADNFGSYKVDSAIAHGEQALALAKRYGPDTLEAWIRMTLVEPLYTRGELWRSMQYAYKAEQHYLSRGDSAMLLNLHNSMGNNLKRQGAWEQAIGYYRPNVRAAERYGQPEVQAYAYMNLGQCYLALDRLDSALHNEELAEALMARIGLPYQGGPFTRLGYIHARLGHREKALGYFRKAVATTMAQQGASRELPNAYVGLAAEYMAQGRSDSAIHYAKEAYGLAVRIPVILEQETSAALLAACYAQRGQLDSAFRYQKILSEVKDSIEASARLIDARTLSAQVEAASDSLKNAAQRAQDRLVAEQEVQRQRTQRNVLLGFGAFGLLFAVVDLRRRRRIKQELARSEALLLNILPEEVAEELKNTGAAQARHFDKATILFTDFKGFTQLSEQVTPAELVAELNTCFKTFDGIMGKYRIEKIKTIGDAYMAAGGLPDPQHGPAADVVRAALEMQDFMKHHKAERQAAGKPFFEMRVGIHSGPVVAGIVGVKKFQYDIWGDTVNTASRMESSGEVGQVNISEATYRLVVGAQLSVVGLGDGSLTPGRSPGQADNRQLTTDNRQQFHFTPRGKVQAKGKGEMEMYFVRGS